MKILWIVNIVMPDLSEYLNIPIAASGSWLVNMSYGISLISHIPVHFHMHRQASRKYTLFLLHTPQVALSRSEHADQDQGANAQGGQSLVFIRGVFP